MNNRSMKMIDAMILVAALAVAFALIRITLPVKDVPPKVVLFLNGMVLVVDCLTASSVACLAIRLRRPHPRLRRLARQPGFAAYTVIAVTMTAIWSMGHIPMVFSIGWI